MPGVIEAIDLTKVFGAITAVDRVSFEVREGEIFGFLGPNGAGKTTTTRMLTGVIPMDGGSARIFGHDIMKKPVQAKQRFGNPHRCMLLLGNRRTPCRPPDERALEHHDALHPPEVPARLHIRHLCLPGADAGVGAYPCGLLAAHLLHGHCPLLVHRRTLLPGPHRYRGARRICPGLHRRRDAPAQAEHAAEDLIRCSDRKMSCRCQ